VFEWTTLVASRLWGCFLRAVLGVFLFWAFALPAFAGELPRGVYPLSGIDERLTNGDLAPLDSVVGDADFVGLGESVHTSGGFYQAKFRVIKHLVENLGFRVVAIENPWTGAEAVGDYVASCQGSPAVAVQKLFYIWQDLATLRLVEWLCDFNRAHPNDPVHFFGFDIQQGWDDGRAVDAFLARWTNGDRQPIMNDLASCAGVGYRNSRAWYSSETYRKMSNGEEPLPASGRELCLETITRSRELVRASSASVAEKGRALIALRSLQAFHDQMYFEGLARASIDADGLMKSTNARDAGMADVLLAIRDLVAPSSRVTVWAHNFHLTKDGQNIDDYPAMTLGSHLASRLSSDFVSLALLAGDAKTLTSFPNPPLPANSDRWVEFRLGMLGHDYLFLDLGDNDLLAPRASYCWDNRYVDRDQESCGAAGVPADQFDGAIFLRTSEPMTPIAG
jgi:erythromycin esterase-like protein